MAAPRPTKTEIQHRLFAKEFFVDLDPGAAYKRAGYKAENPAVIRAAVGQLLTNINVQHYLAEEFAALQARLDLQQDRAVLEVMRLAFSNMRQVCKWGPGGVELIESDDLPEDVQAAVQRVSMHRTVKRKVLEADRAVALPDGTTRQVQLVEEDEVCEVDVRLHPKLPALAQLQAYFRRGVTLTPEAQEMLRAMARLTEQYVPREHMAEFFEAVRDVLGPLTPAGVEDSLAALLQEASQSQDPHGGGGEDGRRDLDAPGGVNP